MDFSEILASGGVVAVIGLGTVFAVLAILWGILELMRVIFAPKKKEDAPAVPAPSVPVPAMAEAPATSGVAAEDEDELIAILTAAVAASLNTSTYRLNIKSYRQINTGTPVWNSVSRRENLQ